jgi:glycine cleavage system H protein
MEPSAPPDLLYTKDHEWAKKGPGEVIVGITAFAVEQLGDITLVNFDVKAGDSVVAGKAFGTIESVKTLSDLYAPVGGTIVRINGELASRPELVNEDCYGKGWMVAIAPADAASLDALLDEKAYAAHVKTASGT